MASRVTLTSPASRAGAVAQRASAPAANSSPVIAAAAASAAPSVRRGLPLPTGQPMRTTTGQAAGNLAEAVLEPGHPVSAAATAILSETRDAIRQEVLAASSRPPVDPTTPRVVLKTIPIETLNQADREKTMANIADTVQAGKLLNVPGIQKPEMESVSADEESVNPDLEEAIAAESRRQASGVAGEVQLTKTLEVELDEPTRRPIGDNVVPDASFVRPTAAAPETSNETTAPEHKGFCPYCAWDLSREADPAPSDTEKLVYTKCTLAGRDYTRELTMFDGLLTARFRALTTRELDVIFQHVQRERRAGRVTSEIDFWERINRYKLYLQLVRLRSDGDEGFDHELNDGLTPRTNPRAKTFWESEEVNADETLLDRIEEAVQSQVLFNESIFRLVYKANLAFNRDLSRLETLAGSASFTKATA